ncbi:rhodanese-like domain-containing protein [Halobaculum gomorrense]|uniref:Rhodanese-related sulfurtransferase n=1 Tax=Halobaculum gomorrense TaxID=43928 RepID=A0A1M5LSW9_9EURY|nr:rhodanese-like domain-containing protein [Halobaculum gomorrense]SHG68148.1 Rhodanese-related sulfurtransferase [Halobaculum gomorrense]
MDGEITPEEVERLLAEDADIRVVDIRSPGAYARGHIPGSENVPFNQLPTRVESLTGSDRIVTVCPHGKASVQAANLIKSFEGTTDARVESMAGGLEEWGGDLEAGDTEDESAAADDGPQSPF